MLVSAKHMEAEEVDDMKDPLKIDLELPAPLEKRLLKRTSVRHCLAIDEAQDVLRDGWIEQERSNDDLSHEQDGRKFSLAASLAGSLEDAPEEVRVLDAELP